MVNDNMTCNSNEYRVPGLKGGIEKWCTTPEGLFVPDHRTRVVLVDDDDTIDVIVKRALKRSSDFKYVGRVGNAETAAERLWEKVGIQKRPVIVLLDRNIDGSSWQGPDFIKAVKQDRITRGTPVVLIGSYLPEEVEIYSKLPWVSVLPKDRFAETKNYYRLIEHLTDINGRRY